MIMNMTQFEALSSQEQHTFILMGNTIEGAPTTTWNLDQVDLVEAAPAPTWKFDQVDLIEMVADIALGYYESGAYYDADYEDYIQSKEDQLQDKFKFSLLCEDYFA